MWVQALSAAVALVAGAGSEMEQARAHYEALRFGAAEKLLRETLERPAPVEERRELLDLLARCVAAAGRLDEAETVYAQMVDEDPHAPGPEDAAPKLRQAFQRAKKRRYPPDHVRLSSSPAGPLTFEVRVEDPWGRVAQLVLLEAQGEGAFVERAVRMDHHRARVVLTAPKSAPLRWYLEARAPDQQVVATLASAEAPAVVDVPAPAARAPGLATLQGKPPPAEPAPNPAAGLTRPAPQPLRSVGIVLGGSGAVALGVGAFVGLRSTQARSELLLATKAADGRVTSLSQREAHDLERSFQRDASAANVLFATGATLAAGGLLLWWLGSPSPGVPTVREKR